MSRLDPRAPLVLDTRSLPRSPGQMLPILVTVQAPKGLGLDVISVPEASDLQLDLRLESVVEGVLVTGFVSADAQGACVRCLEPVGQPLVVDLVQLYAYPGSASAHDEETAQLEDDLIDLEPVLRDAIVLALPLQPLCRDDCPGLCATCGARLADDPEHHHDQIDPRWADLLDLSDDSTERG
ncbi:MAG: YceD family protein [Actinomycetes bacterium]